MLPPSVTSTVPRCFPGSHLFWVWCEDAEKTDLVPDTHLQEVVEGDALVHLIRLLVTEHRAG